VPNSLTNGDGVFTMRTLFTIALLLMAQTSAASETTVKSTSHPDIREFFNKFSKDNIDLADEFYAADIHFEDPLVDIKGLPELKQYYAGLYKNVISIRFDFHDVVTEGDKQIGVWTMYLRAKNLNGGEEVAVKGNSYVIYKNGKAVYHRDYFDMGAFIYEHIPVLGAVIRKIKAMLH
jgi:limonene-1,2-epoxide hydrolase